MAITVSSMRDAWSRRPAPPRGRHSRAEREEYAPPTGRTGIHRAEGGLLRSLYDQHAEPLLMIILEMTDGDRRLAEEVVRETLLRAWREVDSIDVAASSLRPWLVSLARRILRDIERDIEFEEEPPQQRPAYREPPDRFPVLDMADDVGAALQRMMVLDGLRALQRPDRDILVEAYFRGRGVRDVAEELDLPPETVKWRLFFALRALQKILLGAGSEDA
ncbi:sigma-70 family RNA polymerase sigma factor [Micromonospora sp. CPCC 205371]|nr:sigma-70 family RNA polymerase sigma factor [Micromonospora sp. CPCC 205371]